MKSALTKLSQKIKHEAPILFLLLIQMVPQNLDFSEDPYASLLALDYSIGFVPRILPGAVMSLLFDYKGHIQINAFFSVISILTFILVSWIAGKIIRTANEDTKQIAVVFIALFLACPYTISFFFPQMFFPDRLLALSTVIAVLLIHKPRAKWILPFVIFAALATHNMYTFTFMPVIAVLLLYNLFQNKFSLSGIMLCVISFITMAAGSAYFYLFTGLKNTTPAELIAYAGAKTDVPIPEDMFTGYFFLNPSELYKNINSFASLQDVVYSEFHAAIYLIPLIVLFCYIWIKSYRISTKKFEKFIFLVCMLVPAARIPLFPVNSEVYRGRAAVVFTQFALLFYFLYFKNEAVTESVKKIAEFFKRNTLIVIFAVAYFAMAFSSYFFTSSWLDLFGSLLTGTK